MKQPMHAIENTRGLLVIGTSGIRSFIIEQPRRIADELGLDLFLLDKVESRHLSEKWVDDSHFIAADIDSHDPSTMTSIVNEVERRLSGHISAALTFLNPYAQVCGMINDRLGLGGSSEGVIMSAHDKKRARHALEGTPWSTPYSEVFTEEDAVRFQESQDGHSCVIKPSQGGGSALVITDIGDATSARAAFREVTQGLHDFPGREDAGIFILDQNPGILIERQLSGPEVDVEIVLKNGHIIFALVIDNPPTEPRYPMEKGGSAPSILPEVAQKELQDAAQGVCEAIGLANGNAHIEMIMTSEGPKVLEVNARMGGGFVYDLVRNVSDVDLIEAGIRVAMSEPVSLNNVHRQYCDVRYLQPIATGTISLLDGFNSAKASRGVVACAEYKRTGEHVDALPDDFYGWVMAGGPSAAIAEDLVLKALEQIHVKVELSGCETVSQTGLYAQPRLH